MAVAAEQLSAYQSVDQLPFLAVAREQARAEAYQIIESRRELLRQADYEAVPMPVDALGSAQAVVEARSTYGLTSPEASERYAGLQLDCQRLLAEAGRKNTYEYFPPLKQQLDPATGDYYSHGFSILAMTEAGLSPIAEPEELERRVNERVEEVTYRAIGQLALLSQSLAPEEAPAVPKRIRTISECPDWAIEAHARYSKSGHGGYVPEIKKFMVRDVYFDPATGDRFEEQVGLSGLHISHEVITGLLEQQGLAMATELDKAELHALQIETTDSLLEFVAKLDAAAGEQTKQALFMGEPTVFLSDYQFVPIEAEARQSRLTASATELADELIGLELLGTDRWAAAGIVEARVKNILFDMAKTDNSLASAMFDTATAQGLREVSMLQLMGRTEAAEARLQQVESTAPAPSYCGAGSCGLERVDSSTSSKMKEMGLESTGSLKDTERKCPKCSKKEVVYDLKNKIKGCLGCKSKTGFSRQ